ncbi:hypothetical protein BS329_41080 [Amycolatopsis coloradensis]|uniref:Uncharacterized protein n=2 Tax=Amycolatopsis coloradensis TaxID=76021 RepID=A0A1R0KD82_9PSEU|nr:hypothetical protein BS329_41080 [Amycolatopsis coloradensis]
MRVHGAYTHTNNRGSGKCDTLRPTLNPKYDLEDEKRYKFDICLVKNGRYEHCDEAYWVA